MTYKEILAQIGLQIESNMNDSSYDEIITPEFINSFEAFYNNSLTLLENLNEIINNANINQGNSILNLNINTNQLKEKSRKDYLYYETIKHQKNSLIHEDISIEVKNYNFKKEENRIRILKETEEIKNKISDSSLNIKTDNEKLDTFKIPSRNNYNFYIERFSKENSSEYQQYHAHISKNNYSLKNAFDEIEDHFKKENEEILEHINHLMEVSDEKKTDLNDDILKDETMLNQKIKELSEKYLKLKNQNEVQTTLEVTDIKNDIKNIETKYQAEIKNINKLASETLKKIDGEHENMMLELEQEIMDKQYHHNIKIKTNREKYKLLVKDYKSDLSRLTFSQKRLRRNELKKIDKQNKLDESISSLEIEKLLQNKENMQAKNILDRTLVDLRRKYEINSKNLNENLEKYPLLKKLSQIDLEKKSYDRILDNMLSIVINNEKLETELLRITKETNYNIFNTRQLIEIAHLKEQKDSIELDKLLSAKIEELILEFNEQKDKLTLMNSSNTYLLSIEKNKHLNNMNNDLILHNKELNELYLDHFIKLKNINLNHKLELAKEENNYNDLAISNFREIKSNDSDNISSEYKNSLTDYEATYNYNIANEAYKVQQSGKDNVLKVIIEELNVFYKIMTEYKNTLVPHVYKIISYIEENNDKLRYYDDYIHNIYKTFFELIDTFQTRVHKIVQTYIKYNTGNKYDTLEENINYTYSQKIANVEKEIEQYKITCTNYQNGISSFYSSINELNLMVHQEELLLKNNSGKANKKNISLYNSKIRQFKIKITENDHKISNINDEITLLNKKIHKLERIRTNEINKLKALERHDSAASIKFLQDIDDAAAKYKRFLSDYINLELYRKLSRNEYKVSRYYYIVRKFEYKFIKLTREIKKAGEVFNYGVNDTIEQIKLNNMSTYLRTKEIADRQKELDHRSYVKESNRLEQKFIQTNVIHHQKINNLNDYYNDLISKENLDYTNERNNKIDTFNKKVTKYYDLFKSCDDLIKNSLNEYNSSLKQIDNDQRANIAELTHKAKIKKRILQKTTDINVAKYKEEIAILPKYKQNQIMTTISQFKDSNKNLSSSNEHIKEDINLNKKRLKKEIDIYSKEIKDELRKEYNNYKKNQHRIRDEYIENIKKNKSNN